MRERHNPAVEERTRRRHRRKPSGLPKTDQHGVLAAPRRGR